MPVFAINSNLYQRATCISSSVLQFTVSGFSLFSDFVDIRRVKIYKKVKKCVRKITNFTKSYTIKKYSTEIQSHFEVIANFIFFNRWAIFLSFHSFEKKQPKDEKEGIRGKKETKRRRRKKTKKQVVSTKNIQQNPKKCKKYSERVDSVCVQKQKT